MLEKLSYFQEKLDRLTEAKMEQSVSRLEGLKQMHRALGPDTAFSRGFSVTTDEAGEIVRSADTLKGGDVMSTRFRDGVVESVVRGEEEEMFGE